jgi:hypothetical protein
MALGAEERQNSTLPFAMANRITSKIHCLPLQKRREVTLPMDGLSLR